MKSIYKTYYVLLVCFIVLIGRILFIARTRGSGSLDQVPVGVLAFFVFAFIFVLTIVIFVHWITTKIRPPYAVLASVICVIATIGIYNFMFKIATSNNTRNANDIVFESTLQGGLCPEGQCGYPIYRIFGSGEITMTSSNGPNVSKKLSKEEFNQVLSNIRSLRPDSWRKVDAPACQSAYDGADMMITHIDKTVKNYVVCEYDLGSDTATLNQITQKFSGL